MDPEAFFVYGTLRPDDTSNAEWTKPFNEGMESFPARLFGHRLYIGAYAFVISPDPVAEPTDCVVGHVLRPKEKKDWKQKLEDADKIEGYPIYYGRRVVTATLSDGSSLAAWVYFCRVDPSKWKRIPSGDWTKRETEE